MLAQENKADTGGQYDIASLTRIGSRTVNEDRVGWECSSSEIMLVIADGLGGHGMGDVASGIAVDTAKEKLSKAVLPNEYMDAVFCSAHQRILKQQQLLKNKNAITEVIKTTKK